MVPTADSQYGFPVDEALRMKLEYLFHDPQNGKEQLSSTHAWFVIHEVLRSIRFDLYDFSRIVSVDLETLRLIDKYAQVPSYREGEFESYQIWTIARLIMETFIAYSEGRDFIFRAMATKGITIQSIADSLNLPVKNVVQYLAGRAYWLTDADREALDRLAYTFREHVHPPTEFEIHFDPTFVTEEILEILATVTDLYRSCGGLGFRINFEEREVGANDYHPA